MSSTLPQRLREARMNTGKSRGEVAKFLSTATYPHATVKARDIAELEDSDEHAEKRGDFAAHLGDKWLHHFWDFYRVSEKWLATGKSEITRAELAGFKTCSAGVLSPEDIIRVQALVRTFRREETE